MPRSDAVTSVTGEIFREGWSRIRSSRQGLGGGRDAGRRYGQMTRAARGHRAAIFKPIRGGGTHTKAELARQLEYLTTKSSHIVDSRGWLDGKATLTGSEIADVTRNFAKRWDEGFNPKLGHTTHMLMSFPVGTKSADVRDITAAVAERFFTGPEGTFDYLIAVHEDRDHPHAHIVLNRRSQEGELFYLGRDHRFNYDDFRLAMVEEAERVGVRLEATRRVERGIHAYSARTGEVYAAKEEGRAPVERSRVGADLARAAADIATASSIYRSLSAEASDEGREDIADALFRAGELLARNGRIEQKGDVYMSTEQSFDELRSDFAERAERVEAMVREMPDAQRARAEAEVHEIYASMAHMQPLGVRSATLTQAPSEGGVYSDANINRDLTERMREPETRAQIETALRGTGISSEAVIARVGQGASNAALEREWISQDLERIARTDGLNLERGDDLRVAAERLDDVHVKLGTALERAEVLRTDGVIEDEAGRDFHYDEQSVESAARAVRADMRGQGVSDAQIEARTASGEVEFRAEARIEAEQRAYLQDRPEIVAAPSRVFDDAPFGRNVTDREAFDRIARETEAIMDRAGPRDAVEDAVARDFKERYPDMPDHLARGLGQTYAQAETIRNDEAIERYAAEQREAYAAGDRQAAEDADHRDRVSEELRLDAGIANAEAEGIAAQDRRTASLDEEAGQAERLATIRSVVNRERADPVHAPFDDAAGRDAFREAVEREIDDERLAALERGDADALDQVVEDRLDRLYAAKAYLQSDEATADSEAVREVVSEIADEEVEAQRLRHAHIEKGTTHG